MSEEFPEATYETHGLELAHWVKNEKDSVRGWPRELIEKAYKTFPEVRDAILEKGPLSSFSDRVDVTFFVLDGVFDNQIMAVRHSGVNIRRFLIREETFEDMFGNFEHCLNMVRSNLVVENEIELKHLTEYAETLGLSTKVDETREYSRLDVDLTSSMQLLETLERVLEDSQQSRFLFDLGYSVGRLFGSIQNLATLEEMARKGQRFEDSYKERGKKSGSDKRKAERLDNFILEIENVFSNNPALREKEHLVMELAFEKVVPKGTYGHGQFAEYCTVIQSDEPYKTRFDSMFRKSAK